MAFDELTSPLPNYLLGIDWADNEKKDLSVMRIMKIEGEGVYVIRKYVCTDPDEFKKELQRVKDMFFSINIYNEKEIKSFGTKGNETTP